MGFLDKVKEQAAVATTAAKEAAAKGQSKIDEIQAKRAADMVLRDLGLLAYADHVGRSLPSSEADGARLITALQGYEAEYGPIPVVFESPAGRGQSGTANWPPS